VTQQIPDVRVKLSAEGVDEVVRAFQKVSAAAQQNAKKSSATVGLLNEALSELKMLAPAIGLAAAATGIGLLVKDALESADAIGKLAQKTGISTETLSVLTVAAKLADVEFEGLSKGLTKFNKTMGDLDRGSATAGVAVRDLFGSSQALNGLKTDERLTKVVEKLGAMEAGYKKTRLAQDFFGKSGADLIPLMNDLANGGMERMRQKALALGLVIDEKTAASAQRAADAIKLLQLETKGAATQFVSGLTPALSGALETFAIATSNKGVGGMELLGKVAGKVVGTIVAGFLVVGKTIGFVMGEARLAVDDLSGYAKDAAGGIYTIAKLQIGTAIASNPFLLFGKADIAKMTGKQKSQFMNRALDFSKEINKDLDAIFKPKGDPTRKGNPAPDLNNSAGLKALVDERKAAIATALAAIKAELAAQEEDNQHAYDVGLKSLEQYFLRRRALTDATIDSEIAALEREREAVASGPADTDAERIAQRKEIAALDAQIAAKRRDGVQQQKVIGEQQEAAQFALAQARLDMEAKVQTAQGQTYAAALKAIAKEEAALLRSSHLPPALIAAVASLERLAALRDALTKAGESVQGGLDLAKAQLDVRAAAGDLFPYQAVRAFDDATKQAIPTLRQYADAQLAAAITPDQKLAAERRIADIDRMAVEADKSRLAWGQLKASFEGGLQTGITNFLTKDIQNIHSWRDALQAVRNVALSVLDAMEQIAAQRLATLATNALLDLLPGGKKSSTAAAETVGASAALGTAGATVIAGAAALSISAAQLQVAATTLLIANAQGSGSGSVFSAIATAALQSMGVQMADGGIVTGPGTATSDSIPARLSAGEFVMRAAAVQQPGMLDFLAAANRGRQPMSLHRSGVARFADGGLVSGSAIGSGSSGASVNRDHLLVDVHPDLVVRQIETGPGSRAVVRAIGKNRIAIKQALGLK